MKLKKTVAQFNKDRALVFEADMTNQNEVEFSNQLKMASKGTKSLGELLENLVTIQSIEKPSQND